MSANLAIADLRCADEYARGRPPGAVHLSLEDVVQRAYLLPPRVRPLLLVGQSAADVAAALEPMRRAGREVRHLPHDTWRHEFAVETGPATRLRLWEESALVRHAVETYDLHGSALDIACGAGRNAVYLAMQGLDVIGLDRLDTALENAQDLAQRSGVRIRTRRVDLSSGAVLEPQSADVLVVVRYLERALFASLAAALRPAGLLIYETFTQRQATLGHPRNPRFLLDEGELVRAFPSLETVEYSEGFFDGAHLARLVGRRP